MQSRMSSIVAVEFWRQSMATRSMISGRVRCFGSWSRRRCLSATSCLDGVRASERWSRFLTRGEMSYTLVRCRLQTDWNHLCAWWLCDNGNLARDGNSQACKGNAGIRPRACRCHVGTSLPERYSGSGICTCYKKMPSAICYVAVRTFTGTHGGAAGTGIFLHGSGCRF